MKKKIIINIIIVLFILMFITGVFFPSMFPNKDFAIPVSRMLLYLSMIIISCLCIVLIAKKPDYLMERSGLKYLPVRLLAYAILIGGSVLMIIDSYKAFKDLSIGVQEIHICESWIETKTCGKGHCDYLVGRDGNIDFSIKITEKHKEIKEYLVDHNCIDVEYYKNLNYVYKVKGVN